MKISEIVESRGHKIIATKLKDIERKVEIPTPQQRKNYDDARDTVKKPVKEGAVKTLMMDLQDMSDEEFQSRYRMTKQQARAKLQAKEGMAEGDHPKARMVRDRKTGKMYDPDAEFKKLQKDPEYVAQMTRMGKEQGRGWPSKS